MACRKRLSQVEGRSKTERKMWGARSFRKQVPREIGCKRAHGYRREGLAMIVCVVRTMDLRQVSSLVPGCLSEENGRMTGREEHGPRKKMEKVCGHRGGWGYHVVVGPPCPGHTEHQAQTASSIDCRLDGASQATFNACFNDY